MKMNQDINYTFRLIPFGGLGEIGLWQDAWRRAKSRLIAMDLFSPLHNAEYLSHLNLNFEFERQGAIIISCPSFNTLFL